uniref:ATP-dependent DNA helicase n=1 Tax=Oryza sativa subsp. japonica TaxID=39947 RepID=Q6UU02_ORYSJ|nr:hypothetical protein OSJNBa0070J19.12 [Oryza sativa Japonica Group]
MGVNVIDSINDGRGPYVFKISGQLCHCIGSLIPKEGRRPEYAQLYIFDTENEIRNRMNVGTYANRSFCPNEDIVAGLIDMFNTHNPIVHLFRTARDRLAENGDDRYIIRLFGDPDKHGDIFSAPVASEVVGLVVGDVGISDVGHDLIVQDQAEVTQALAIIPGQHSADRPDIINRVFHVKLHLFMDDIVKKKFFGPVTAVVYTIEFQKRGLPHVHIILWLDKSGPLTPADIDRLISAQLPDPSIDRVGYDAVAAFMMHGPCGDANPHCSCMVDGKCSKNYPKEYSEKTTILPNGHVRCIAPNEAAWRLLQFEIHYTDPAIERLHVHMPLENNVTFTEDDNLEQILDNPRNRVTKLTAWFAANREYSQAAAYTYAEFPEYFTWHGNGKYWAPQKNCRKKIGRIAHVCPAQGDVYYLRMLLHIVKGAKSYSDLRTIEGHVYPTFQAACQALGLLGDDREWSFAMTDATHWALPYQLRELFVTLLLFCDVTHPLSLFEEHLSSMGQDAAYHLNHATLGINSSAPSVIQYVKSYVLSEIDSILRNVGRTLAYFHLPEPTIQSTSILGNRLLIDEQAYDLEKISIEAADQLGKLNLNQRHIYDAILNSLNSDIGHTFFIYGYGGTGKTFLWNTLLNSVRAERKIALAVASSGIASLLLPGGRTPHSCFRIPLDIQEHSVCSIKKNTHLAQLIQQTSLVIWDEAPVNHKHCFEALDRTLRDILASNDPSLANKQFGRITVVLGGDFRQTLPLTTQEMSYYSSDTIEDTTSNRATLDALYPTEFLNTIKISGLPDHHLQLKIGVPIMLLRNLNPSKGLCNGTRLIVTQLTRRVIEGEIITGKAKGSKAYIPRIQGIYTKDSNHFN